MTGVQTCALPIYDNFHLDALAAALPSVVICYQQQLVRDYAMVRPVIAGILFVIEPLYGQDDITAPPSG